MQNTEVMSIEQRLAAVIGQIIVDNAKLGAEVDRLRLEVIRERKRAEAAEKLINEIEARQ